jgi:hypothetical protein
MKVGPRGNICLCNRFPCSIQFRNRGKDMPRGLLHKSQYHIDNEGKHL